MTLPFTPNGINFHPSNQNDKYFAIATIAIELLIIVPLLCYSSYRYYHHISHTCIAKRRPRAVMITLGVSTLFILWNACFITFGSELYTPLAFELCIIVVYPFVWHAIFYSMLFRFWLLYFDIEWSVACKNSQWKKHIDPSLAHASWFSRNKEGWGNELQCAKWLVIFYVSSAILSLLGFLLLPIHSAIYVDFGLILVPMVAVIVLWRKTPKQHDHFRIREECRTFCIIQIINLPVYFAFGLLSQLASRSFIFSMITQYSFCFLLTVACLSISWWVLKKNAHKMGDSPAVIYIRYRSVNAFMKQEFTRVRAFSTGIVERARGRSAITSLSVNMGTSALRHPQPTENSSAIFFKPKNTLDSVVTILEDERSFDAFMNHLSGEYSTENGLALIEFTQYQVRMKQLCDPQFDPNSDKFPVVDASPESRPGNFMSLGADEQRKKRKGESKRSASGSGSGSTEVQYQKELPAVTEEKTPESEDSPPAAKLTALPSDSVIRMMPEKKRHSRLTRSMQLLHSERLKSILNARGDEQKSNPVDNSLKIIQFPESVPLSEIVFGKSDGNSDDVRVTAIKLIDKYVANSSNFEINIASALRKKLMSQKQNISDLSYVELIHMFDDTIITLIHLLNDSLRRFVQTPQFKILQKYDRSVNKQFY